jgi:hypothetical protein
LKSFIPLAVLFGIKYLPFNEEENLFAARVCFGFKIVLTLIVCCLVYVKISSFPYKPSDVVKEHEEQGAVIPTMGISDYDKAQLRAFLKSQVVPTFITLLIHYKFNYVQPLYISTVMAVISLWDWNLFQIYVLKKDGTADKALRRPFPSAKTPGFMDAMNKKMQEAQERTEKKDK